MRAVNLPVLLFPRSAEFPKKKSTSRPDHKKSLLKTLHRITFFSHFLWGWSADQFCQGYLCSQSMMLLLAIWNLSHCPAGNFLPCQGKKHTTTNFTLNNRLRFALFLPFYLFWAILVFAGWPQAAFVSFTAVFPRVWMNKKCHLILSRDCVFISVSFLLLVKRRGESFRDEELNACKIKFVAYEHKAKSINQNPLVSLKQFL